MPRAFTGCTEVLYRQISPASLKKLKALEKKVAEKQPHVSPSMYLDKMIEKVFTQSNIPTIEKPEYKSHTSVKKARKAKGKTKPAAKKSVKKAAPAKPAKVKTAVMPDPAPQAVEPSPVDASLNALEAAQQGAPAASQAVQ